MRALWLTVLSLISLSAAWEQSVPEEIARDYLEADRVLDEQPCEWRETVAALFRPAVQRLGSAEEAVLYIASHMTELSGGVHYSTDRRKPNMNALEALAEKKVSCTGQSILLVCALRSVGIPARAVCVPTWNHVRGNHTWAEAWVNGEWKMIEFNEKNYNTPWVMESVGLLNPELPWQRVYAAAPSSRTVIPYGRSMVRVVDVTDRYSELALAWYRSAKLPENHQRLMVDVQPRPQTPLTLILETEDGTCLASAPSPTADSDLRSFTPFNLPVTGQYYIRIDKQPVREPVAATKCPAQVKRLALPEASHE